MDNKSLHIIDADHHSSIQKSKKNINRMILFNSFLYMLSHLPECFMSIFLIVKAKVFLNFCSNNVSCDLLNEEASFFSLFSIVFQFYIFKSFDKNFKASYENLKSRLFSRCFNSNKIKENTLASINSIKLKNLNKLIGNGLID